MKDKISNFFNSSYKLLCLIMLIMWGGLILLTFSYIIPRTSLTSELIILIGAIIYILFLIFVYHKLEKLKPKTHDIIAIVISLISFIILVTLGLTHRSVPFYDLKTIINKIIFLLNTNNHVLGEFSYFSRYPHQLPMFVVIYFVEYIGKILFNDPEATIIIFNCFMLSLSFYFIYKTIKEINNSKAGIIGLIISSLYLDFYLFSSHYYSDVLCIPFATIGFYCLIKASKCEKIKKYLLLILGGIVFGIATKLRVVAGFLLIAYIIDLILKGNIKELLKKGITILIPFSSIFLLHNILINQYFKVEIDKEKTFPVTHFIMMGLNQKTLGAYDSADSSFTYNSKDKVNDNIMVIKERLKTVNLDFYVKKFASNWAHGQHFGAGIFQNVSKVDDFYPFVAGYNTVFIEIFSQIMIIVIYVLFFVSIFKELNKKSDIKHSIVSSIIIAIFGAILFHLVWEAKNRYSVSFIEWLIIGAALGFEPFYNYFNKSINKIKDNRINKNIGKIMIILVVIILMDGFIEYSYKYREIDVTRYNQELKDWKLNPEDKEIKQYFEVNDTFNKIQLTFNDNKIVKEIPYKFELYNMDNNLLYSQTFNSTYKKGITTKNFEFASIVINKPTKFYIKLYSEEATADNYLNVAAYTPDAYSCIKEGDEYINYGYDVMPQGETYIQDKKTCHELSMKVYEHKLSNKIRKKYYIVYSFIILLITYLGVNESFFKSKNVKNKFINK